MSRKLDALVRVCVAVGAICLSGAARPAPAAATPQDLDRRLQSLKEEAVQLNRDLQLFEQATRHPDQSRTTLYVSVDVGGFLLEQVSVRIDDQPAVRYDYTASEARALLFKGWHRMLELSLEPGTYRLTTEFIGRFHDAGRRDGSLSGKLETLIEKGPSELDIVLPISRNTRLDKPGLSEVMRLESRTRRPGRNVWLPAAERLEGQLPVDQVGGENDPRYRTALFLQHDKRYFSALTELSEILQQVPDPATLPPAFHALLAECYLGFGMELAAERVYREVAAQSPDPLDAARAQLEVARFEYERGYLSEAVATLLGLRERLPESLLGEWRQLLVSTLLAQGRYNEAVEVFSTAGDVDRLSPVLQYNLAVALVHDGRNLEGRRQLNRVGTMSADGLDMLALRDKANLTLGYQFLQTRQGENARAVFGRIRVEGPFSNRALLGLGWAELAPRKAPEAESVEAEGRSTDNSLGSLLRPGFVDGQPDRLQVETRGIQGISAKDRDSLLRALIPWVELVKRDPMDPAVQEGMLAIPWALDHLQAYEQSLKYYTDAIATLETARKRIDEAIESIGSGRMVNNMIRRDPNSEAGWKWRLRDLVDTPENYFLQTLVAGHRFQETLKNYRDARLLSRILDAWSQKLDDLAGGGAAGGPRPVERLFDRARRGWQPPWAGRVIWLRYATELAPPGTYAARAPERRPPPEDLWVASAPDSFEGVAERLAPLYERLRALRPRMSEAAAAQGRLLARISNAELEGQKKQIERYLTEARFAVARIYDRQLKEGRP